MIAKKSQGNSFMGMVAVGDTIGLTGLTRSSGSPKLSSVQPGSADTSSNHWIPARSGLTAETLGYDCSRYDYLVVAEEEHEESMTAVCAITGSSVVSVREDPVTAVPSEIGW